MVESAASFCLYRGEVADSSGPDFGFYLLLVESGMLLPLPVETPLATYEL